MHQVRSLERGTKDETEVNTAQWSDQVIGWMVELSKIGEEATDTKIWSILENDLWG